MEAAKSSRFSRRHSSIGSTSDNGRQSIIISRRKREAVDENDKLEGDGSVNRRESRSSSIASLDSAEGGSLGRAASRRRSMMI